MELVITELRRPRYSEYLVHIPTCSDANYPAQPASRLPVESETAQTAVKEFRLPNPSQGDSIRLHDCCT